ncbi:protein disulfide isomerase MPD1 [Sugiyamaella lignohabitans]|uniref:Protein disulfide isomerase MPD1 n=1 Tax=Sugiyamaella lignohabitans TaxID=796027 RepID=A0A161HMB7_9ASCO|nr:protein disulfide isomerase MPD1 [Sugiyamaella lignohabitans]ANB14797.1 protein disulfide isomerase MPD1 [Sugiyamaella lignohabitans]
MSFSLSRQEGNFSLSNALYKLFSTVFIGFLLIGGSVTAAGFYEEEGSPVRELNPKTFQKEVVNSNSVSIVEFYAPWCGYCQKLLPEYLKAAKSLKGLATVAAVNCDDRINKELCATYKIEGFPTIKVFRPHKVDLSDNNKRDLNKRNIRSPPAVEVYNGERKADNIVNFVMSRLRNYVAALKPGNIDGFLTSAKTANKPKVIVLASVKSKHSGSGVIPPLLKALSSDFVYKYAFGYIDHKQPDSLWEKFGISKDPLNEEPKLIIIPPRTGSTSESDSKDESPIEPIIYSGTLKKAPIAEFLDTYIKDLRRNLKKKKEEEKEKNHVQKDSNTEPEKDLEKEEKSSNEQPEEEPKKQQKRTIKDKEDL